MKFPCLSLGGTGHSRQFVIHTEIVLNGNGSVGLSLLLNLYIFFCLHCLVESVTPAAAWHQTSGILINNHYLATLHDILLILFVQTICL